MSPVSHFISMSSTSSQSMHYVFPSPGATRLQRPLHLPISDVPGPLWAIGATICITPRSIHFQTFHVPNSHGSHFISMSYTSGCSMHYVSPLSPGSHQASTPFTFSYFGRSRSPVSHRSHYMNHAKIYPFLDVSCPQWALEGTLYQCPIQPAVRCTTCPLSPGSHQVSTPFTFS